MDKENKVRVTFTLDQSTINELRKVSKQTDIPQARIVERAILKELKKLSE